VNRSVKWFRYLVWFGILVNFAFGLLGLFAPNLLFALFHLEPAVPSVWTRDAGLFLILVSLFYIPAAQDPYRYRFNAYLLVLGRFTYVLFWFCGVYLLDFGREYLIFGISDLIISVPQAYFLLLVFRTKQPMGSLSQATRI
jgi:hypothetical protein